MALPFDSSRFKLNRLPVLRSLHWAVGQAMRQAGYRWEPRRSGELKIGLWRKSWNRKASLKGRSTATQTRRLVLIPGFGDTPMSWLIVLGLLRPVVRKHFDEIVLIDFPGYSGFLSHERPFHSMELLKNSLFDILDTLKPDTLLGHSLGGWLAALYAVECGEKQRPKVQASGPHSYQGPASVLLADPSGIFVDEQEREALQQKFKKAIEAREKGFDWLRPHVFAREPFWFKWLASQFSSFFMSEEIAQFLESFEASHLLDESRLPQIRARVWLLWGEKDTLIPPTSIPIWLRKLNESEQLCRAIMMTGVGHSPQIESPAALAVVLSQVFAEAHGEKAPLLKFPASERWWKMVEEA